MEFFVTDVAKSGIILNKFIVRYHYHTFWELKVFINLFDVLSSVFIDICATSLSLNSFTKVTGVGNIVYRQNTLCGN